MGTIRKRGGKYYAEVCVLGQRKGKTLRTKREAQRWIIDIEEGLAPLNPAKITLHDAVEKYLKEVAPGHKGEKQEALRLRRIVKELPNKPLSQLTPSDLSDWKVMKLEKVSNPTVRRYMTALSGVFTHCVREWGYLSENPLNRVRKPPSNPPRNRYPTKEDVKLILAELKTGKHKKQVAVTFKIALETAMRAGEILSLNRGNIDYKRRVATLTDTKNGDTREVPLSSKAVKLLKSVDPGYFTVSSETHSQLFRRAVNDAGIDNIRFHDSRAAGLMKLSKKVDVLTLARIAGMRDTKTLMIYYRETAEDIAKILG